MQPGPEVRVKLELGSSFLKASTGSFIPQGILGLGIMVPPGNGHVRIRPSASKKVTGSIAPLKCIYTNAHNMGNTQEELEAIVQWFPSWKHSGMIHTTGVLLWMPINFRKDRLGRRGSRVALCGRECFDCIEHNDGDNRVVYGQKLEGRPTRQISWLDSIRDHPTKMRR